MVNPGTPLPLFSLNLAGDFFCAKSRGMEGEGRGGGYYGDAGVKVLFTENRELFKVFSFKPVVVGQNTARRACLTARNVATNSDPPLVLTLSLPKHLYR